MASEKTGTGKFSGLTEGAIRPDELMVENDRLHRLDLEELRRKEAKFVRVGCPACGSRNSRPKWQKDGFCYVECLKCDTVFVNPRPTQKILKDYYQHAQNYMFWSRVVFPRTEKSRLESIVKPRVSRVLEICDRYRVRYGTLLEVGAGFGTFCAEIKAAGKFRRVVAIEPTPDLAKACERKGIETIALPVEEAATGEKSANVVVSFEVIEHLFSPRGFIEGCRSALRKGGVLVLTCPNLNGFDVVTLGSVSQVVDVEHLNYFHPASISRLLERCGFEILEIQTPGRLDAEIVRKRALAGLFDLDPHPFLKYILTERWESVGTAFQDFLAANMLSSHMWIVARKKV